MNGFGNEIAKRMGRIMLFTVLIVVALVAGAFALGWWMA